MTPLVLPCDAAQLARDVARLWPGAAEVCGVDPARVCMRVLSAPTAGALYWHLPEGTIGRFTGDPDRAAEQLARSLEDAGYVVRRDGSARVVLGWAGTEVPTTWSEGGGWRNRRLADLPPFHPAVERRRDALLRERQGRDAATAPAADAKREHGAAMAGQARRAAR